MVSMRVLFVVSTILGHAVSADITTSYSIAQFETDCQQAGGTPRIFANSASCERPDKPNILCLVHQSGIHECQIAPVLPLVNEK